MPDYRVYLIENQTHKRFFGVSDRVRDEIVEHNRGKIRVTAEGRPWKLVWMSTTLDRVAAAKLEAQLKRHKDDKSVDEYLKKIGKFVEEA